MSDIGDIAALRQRIHDIEANGTPKRNKRRKGVSDEDLSGSEAAFKKIVALVNASDKSEFTLRERLARESFSPNDIDEAIERARSYGFINDMRYAEVLIRSRLNQGRGMCGVERELRDQNIAIEDVEGWPYEFGVTDESEYQRALEVLKRNPSRSKNLRDGAYRKLMQKGYSSSVSASAARSWVDG